MNPRIPIDHDKIKAFCEKWKIVEFSLFGSVLTDEFRPDSDVDVLVEFASDAKWKLWDIDGAEQELAQIIGRPVDLVERVSIERSSNYLRRNHILSHARPFEYEKVNWERVWQIIQDDVPELIRNIAPLVPPETKTDQN